MKKELKQEIQKIIKEQNLNCSIREFQNKVYWDGISVNQKLSEDFIREFQNKVYWDGISEYQKLSEDFIREFQNKVDWYRISEYQKLSEDFIREFQNKVDWDWISEYQKLSEDFIREFDLKISDNNWLYKDIEFKKKHIKENTSFNIIDNKYIIAYKSVRSDNYSCFNFQYQYFPGNVYETNQCDCNIDNENSFGLSAWTKEKALEYHNKGKLLKIKINIEDIGAIVQNEQKIRCWKLEVLEEIEFLT